MQQTRVHGVDRFLRSGHLSGGSGAVSASPVAHIRREYENTYIESQGANDDENRHDCREFNSGDTFQALQKIFLSSVWTLILVIHRTPPKREIAYINILNCEREVYVKSINTWAIWGC